MCEKCNGTGIVIFTDYVPYGSTTAALETAEYCECTEINCPMCGNNTEDTNHWDEKNECFNPCPFCGWDIENGNYVEVENNFDDLICLDCVDDDCEKCIYLIKFEKGE